MFLGNAKDGGEAALEVLAQEAARSPVLTIAPLKLKGKTKYMFCSSCLRVCRPLKIVRNWQFWSDIFRFIKLVLSVHSVVSFCQDTTRFT